MGKDLEDKITEIHDAVIFIKSELAAHKEICTNNHEVVDARISGIHKKIVGNGRPGLEQNVTDLTSRFDKLENKVIVWASVALLVGQVIAPKIIKLMGLS